MGIGLQANRGCTCDSTAKGYVYVSESCFNICDETLESDEIKKKTATDCVILHTMTKNNNNRAAAAPHNFPCMMCILTTAGAAAAAVRQQRAAFPAQQ